MSGGIPVYDGTGSHILRPSSASAGGATGRRSSLVAPDWPRCELTYRHRSATYHIIVDNAAATGRAVTVDATDVPDGEITLRDDGNAHAVRGELG